jgi:hypothetical protein
VIKVDILPGNRRMATGAIAFEMLGWLCIQVAGHTGRWSALIIAACMTFHTIQRGVLAIQGEKSVQSTQTPRRK